MLIIGCDYHPGFQQIAWVDSGAGECGERQLLHSNGEAETFYRDLKQQGIPMRVGVEATVHARWFEHLLAELKQELWVGDPAQIKASRVRKQKTDRRDAEHILKLMLENRFPRVWRPGSENRDLRQLLSHRHRLVRIRTRVMNQLQAVALNEGIQRKKGLSSQNGRAQLESLRLAPWAARRRQDLLELADRLSPNSQCRPRSEPLLRPDSYPHSVPCLPGSCFWSGHDSGVGPPRIQIESGRSLSPSPRTGRKGPAALQGRTDRKGDLASLSGHASRSACFGQSSRESGRAPWRTTRR
jgi:hypothetical protein